MKGASVRILPRYSYIDALRGVAIIGVLLAHATLYSTISYPAWLTIATEVTIGPRGVQLFFLVSAFTLCLSFTSRKDIEKHPTRNFYIRRFFRIAPLFYLSIVYYLFQEGYWSGNPNHFSLLNILTTFTFINGFFPYWINNIVYGGWSIAVEATFYLLFPFIFLAYKHTKIAVILTVASMIIIQVARLYLLTIPYIFTNPTLETYTFEFFPSQLPIFLLGMMVFVLMKSKASLRNSQFLQRTLLVFLVVVLFQMVFHLKIIAGHYIFALFFALLLFILSKKPYKILVNPIIIYLGKVSFSLYLCHVAVLYWLTQLGIFQMLPEDPYLNYVFRLCIFVPIATLLATILFHTVERGGIILGKRIINRSEKVTTKYVTAASRTW